MPTYEYECRKCGHEFEQFQSMTDAPLKRCPKKGCRGMVRRKISGGAGLLFKGSGFYITDYRSAGYKSQAKSDSGAASAATPATPAAKTEGAKPAASKS